MKALLLEVCVVALLTSSGSAQTTTIPNLEGEWKMSGGAEVWITQNGNRVVSKYTEVSTMGFKPGDVDFTGTISGSQLSCESVRHYPIKYRALCPKQWSSIRHANCTISKDGDEITQKWRQGKIQDDCSEISGSFVTTKYERVHIEVIEVHELTVRAAPE